MIVTKVTALNYLEYFIIIVRSIFWYIERYSINDKNYYINFCKKKMIKIYLHILFKISFKLPCLLLIIYSVFLFISIQCILMNIIHCR